MRASRRFVGCLGLMIAQLLILEPAFAVDLANAGKTISLDQNKDGKPDHWQTFDQNGVSVLVASDKNGDGKIDYWLHPIRGLMILREYDRNFDGRVDDRQITDLIYDNLFKISRHLYLWREADDNYDGVIDVYKVRGEKNPVPNKIGQKMDQSPWSQAKEAALVAENQQKKSEFSTEKEQVRQMNARQDMGRS